MCDFNLEVFKICSDSRIMNYYLQLVSYGLFPTILRATRVTNTNASLIGKFWVSNSETIVRSGNILCNISDHYLTFCSFSLNGSTYHKPQVLMYKKIAVNQTCRDSFFEKLGNVNRNSLTLPVDVNELTSNIIETIQQKFCECFTMVTINRTKKYIDEPYITGHNEQLIRKKQALQRNYYRQPNKFEKD